MSFHTIIWQAFMETPPVTRVYMSACLITTLSVQLDIVTPYQLYFNQRLIIKQFHFWRLITNFLFLGYFGISFFFNVIFAYKYCRMLEENTFRGRTADFIMMFIFGGLCMILTAVAMTDLVFLGHALTMMIVYVWARQNPYIQINLFGMFTFPAPYLPFALLSISFIMGGSLSIDLLGIVVGHLYYFMEFVFPLQPTGRRLLRAPWLLRMLCETSVTEARRVPPEDRPGGFAWGINDPLNNNNVRDGEN